MKFLLLISFFVLSFDGNALVLDVPYFKDKFNTKKNTNYFWAHQCQSAGHILSGSESTWGTQDRLGQCWHRKETLLFRIYPFDRRNKSDIGRNKGGGEITQPFVKSGEPGSVIIQNGAPIRQGWDVEGTSYMKIGNIVRFYYRLRINDVSMFEKDLVTSLYLFQQHSHYNKSCDDNTFTYQDASGKSVNFDKMAPVGALNLRKDQKTGKYRFIFYTKNRDHPYYRKGNINKVCDSGGKPVCITSLWQREFDPKTELKKWFNFAVEMKIAKQKTRIANCLAPLKALTRFSDPKKRIEAYERCRPSDGYLTLFFNGKRVKGNGSDLPWVTGATRFQGVTTQFNNCSPRPHIGAYTIGYKPQNLPKTAPGDPPRIEVEYDHFTIKLIKE